MFDNDCTTADTCTREGCEVKAENYDAHDFSDGMNCVRDGCDAIDENTIKTETYTFTPATNDPTKDANGYAYFDVTKLDNAGDHSLAQDAAGAGIAVYSKDSNYEVFLMLGDEIKTLLQNNQIVSITMDVYVWGTKDKTTSLWTIGDKRLTDGQTVLNDTVTFTLDLQYLDSIIKEGGIWIYHESNDSYYAVKNVVISYVDA